LIGAGSGCACLDVRLEGAGEESVVLELVEVAAKSRVSLGPERRLPLETSTGVGLAWLSGLASSLGRISSSERRERCLSQASQQREGLREEDGGRRRGDWRS